MPARGRNSKCETNRIGGDGVHLHVLPFSELPGLYESQDLIVIAKLDPASRSPGLGDVVQRHQIPKSGLRFVIWRWQNLRCDSTWNSLFVEGAGVSWGITWACAAPQRLYSMQVAIPKRANAQHGPYIVRGALFSLGPDRRIPAHPGTTLAERAGSFPFLILAGFQRLSTTPAARTAST
jgi:hypothetical protein